MSLEKDNRKYTDGTQTDETLSTHSWLNRENQSYQRSPQKRPRLYHRCGRRWSVGWRGLVLLRDPENRYHVWPSASVCTAYSEKTRGTTLHGLHKEIIHLKWWKTRVTWTTYTSGQSFGIIEIFNCFFFCSPRLIYLIKNTVKTEKMWNIIPIQNNCFLFEYSLKCNLFLWSKMDFQHHYSLG